MRVSIWTTLSSEARNISLKKKFLAFWIPYIVSHTTGEVPICEKNSESFFLKNLWVKNEKSEEGELSLNNESFKLNEVNWLLRIPPGYAHDKKKFQNPQSWWQAKKFEQGFPVAPHRPTEESRKRIFLLYTSISFFQFWFRGFILLEIFKYIQ